MHMWHQVVIQILLFAQLNFLHPNINIHILHTVLVTFTMLLTRRIFLAIRSFLNKWSFPLFILLSVICGWRVLWLGEIRHQSLFGDKGLLSHRYIVVLPAKVYVHSLSMRTLHAFQHCYFICIFCHLLAMRQEQEKQRKEQEMRRRLNEARQAEEARRQEELKKQQLITKDQILVQQQQMLVSSAPPMVRHISSESTSSTSNTSSTSAGDVKHKVLQMQQMIKEQSAEVRPAPSSKIAKI